MDYVFEFNGGVGKHILFTSFIKWINEKYPKSKITVISPYPDIFEYNPRVWRNLPIGQAYLFQDYIQGRDYRKADPYLSYEFYREKNKKHFNEICPIAFGFNELNKKWKNEIFLTNGERAEFMELEQKKIITLQANGGIPTGHQMNVREKIDCDERDIPMPMAIKIVNYLRNKGYEVVQVRGPADQAIPGTTQLQMPFRNFMSLGIHAKGHIGIDSSFMHAMAAFERPQLIFWGQTHVDNLGYKYPKVLNIWKSGAMKFMPQVSMPDRNAIYPRVDLHKADYWAYSDEEIEKYIDNFLEMTK